MSKPCPKCGGWKGFSMSKDKMIPECNHCLGSGVDPKDARIKELEKEVEELKSYLEAMGCTIEPDNFGLGGSALRQANLRTDLLAERQVHEETNRVLANWSETAIDALKGCQELWEANTRLREALENVKSNCLISHYDEIACDSNMAADQFDKIWSIADEALKEKEGEKMNCKSHDIENCTACDIENTLAVNARKKRKGEKIKFKSNGPYNSDGGYECVFDCQCLDCKDKRKGEKMELEDEIAALKAENEKLKREIKLGDEIMGEWRKVLDAIPECPIHGTECVPHAVDWIKDTKDRLAKLEKVVEVVEKIKQITSGPKYMGDIEEINSISTKALDDLEKEK